MSAPLSGPSTSASLSDLPDDELLRYGCDLGLSLPDNTPRGELLRRIRARQELLLDIDRAALLDIAIWARRPVRRSAGKEELVHEIARVRVDDLAGLSRRGLEALARLRGVELEAGEADERLAGRVRDSVGVWERMRQQRRRLVTGMLGKLVGSRSRQQDQKYHFLPEAGATGQLGESTEKPGIVNGIARRIKGVADEYVDAKLDEIEDRIDHKLDEIDARLAEWRDRELTNRIRIIKITLAGTILVGLLSLGYSLLKHRTLGEDAPGESARQVEPSETPPTSGEIPSSSN